MNRLTDWIRRHPVVAFFLLTFAITWGLGFSYDAALKRNEIWAFPLAFVATCGPALAGILLTAICNTQPRQGKRRAFWIAFTVALLVSGTVFVANNTLINHAPLKPILVGFAFLLAVPVAFIIAFAWSRIPAVRSYLSSLVRIRGVWNWVLIALVLIPVLFLVSIFASSLLDRQPLNSHPFENTGLTLIGLIAVKFAYQFFFFNATGEEVGWRGFALPRLQTGLSPLVAILILTFFWAPWHFFLFQAQGSPVLTFRFWLEEYLALAPATVIIVWLYNRSRGSILVAGVAHASANTAFAFATNLDYPVYLWVTWIAALAIILAGRLWKKLPADHPAVFQPVESVASFESPALAGSVSGSQKME